MRAAHSLTGYSEVDDLVVIGPATSKNFEVVDSAEGCDVLVGSGPRAPKQALSHGVPLVWDGDAATSGAHVWGANPSGLALAVASRESDPRVVAVAHPALEVDRPERTTQFPAPVGNAAVVDTFVEERPLALATSKVFAAVLVESGTRKATIVDDGAFMSGIALAAGVACLADGGSVWENALPYLQAATAMGLVMAETT